MVFMVARDGVEPPTPSLFRAAYYQRIPLVLQQLNFAEWPQFCDHSVTSADVRLSVGPVEAGMILAALVYIRKVTQTTTVSEVTAEYIRESHVHLLRHKEIPSYVGIFRIHGPFLFGATDKLDAIVSRLHELPPIIILRLRNMTAIDSTGLQALEKLADQVHDSGRQLILCGAREQPAKRMKEAGLHRHLGPQNVCVSVAAALERAKTMRPETSEQYPEETSLGGRNSDTSS